jgi:hypothetical protein
LKKCDDLNDSETRKFFHFKQRETLGTIYDDVYNASRLASTSSVDILSALYTVKVKEQENNYPSIVITFTLVSLAPCPASPERRRPSATGLLLRTHSAGPVSQICFYLKARAGYALKPSMTRLHNEESVNYKSVVL